MSGLAGGFFTADPLGKHKSNPAKLEIVFLCFHKDMYNDYLLELDPTTSS